MAETETVNCIYYLLSKEKGELLDEIGHKQKQNWERVCVIDTSGLNVEDVLETLTEQLNKDKRRIFCVIDEVTLLSTRQKEKSLREENAIVLKKLDEFAAHNRVGIVCNLFVSRYATTEEMAIEELREYVPIELLENNLQFFIKER